MSGQSVIAQVSNDAGGVELLPNDEMTDDYNTEIHMDLRGQMFTISRDDLMALPESVLLCLFPNGVFVDRAGNVITNLTEDDVVYVNFSPECFQYICKVFDGAVQDLQVQEAEKSPLQRKQVYDMNDPSILNDKPSIIVLREDLDYYVIPPKTGMRPGEMRQLKELVGQQLCSDQKIFNGLGYSPGKQLKPAEQHLMDMLCTSGFSSSGDWGHRSMEPGKTVIFSLTLVRLQNPATDSKESSLTPSSSLNPISSSTSIASSTNEHKRSPFSVIAHAVRNKKKEKQNSNASKLLLFWRKPARKCWWSDTEQQMDLNAIGIKDDNGNPLGRVKVSVHIRRVWTLELSIIGVQ